MKPESTLSRIRQARHEISQQVDHDPKRLVDYYIKLQEQHDRELAKSPKQDSLGENG